MKRLLIYLIILTLFSSCKAWLEFDAKRIMFGFIFTLVTGVVGFIFSLFKNENK